MYRKVLITVIAVAAISASEARASLIHFTNKSEWEAAVGSFTTITFTEFPAATPVTDHYSHLGVTFLTLNFILESSAFVNDLWGLHGPNGVRFTFDTPQNWIAADFPGAVQFQFYLEGQVIDQSMLFHAPGSAGVGGFAGVMSALPFDEVYIFKPQPPFSTNTVFIDDLHWGAIPTPGALTLFALAALGVRRRRT